MTDDLIIGGEAGLRTDEGAEQAAKKNFGKFYREK